jgi:UDP-2-acetamido-3-amino-2,3-dideoxy-glucuronate N-acetyltransferase
MSNFFKHETAIIDDGAKIGDGSKIWHWTHICSKAVIGKNCSLGQNVFVANNVKIGNGVKIQNNVSIYEPIEIEDDVFCGPSMVFTNVNNPRSHVERKDEYLLTKIRKGATLGANCTIICGVEVGEYSLVGAGAVVTKDVSPHSLMVGVPARQAGWVSHAGEILDASLICPKEKRRYKVIDEKLVEVK